MTLKSLYNLVLKIIGLLFIKDLLIAVPSLVTMLLYGSMDGGFDNAFASVIPIVIGIGIYLLCMFLLIFRTDMLIEKLKLTPEPDTEMIRFSMHRSTVLMIALIIISGFLLIDNLPIFINQLYNYFNQSRSGLFGVEQFNKSYFIIPGVKILLAAIMIIYQREIINAVELKRKNNDAS